MAHGEFAGFTSTSGSKTASYQGKSASMLQPRATQRKRLSEHITELRSYHSKQSQLCEKLEELADLLPDHVENQECLTLARLIYPEMKHCHDFEESVLFREARTYDPDNLNLASTLERLRYEHWEDESFAEELTEALTSFVTEPENRNPEKLAYMLRGFFEGLRRHIAFEREHLIPILQGFAGNNR